MPDNGHDLFFAAERGDRVPIAKSFRICRQIWFDAIILLCSSIRNAETRLHFVQDKDTSVFFGLFPDQFKESILWIDGCAISLTRFSDHSRDLFPVRTHDTFKSL